MIRSMSCMKTAVNGLLGALILFLACTWPSWGNWLTEAPRVLWPHAAQPEAPPLAGPPAATVQIVPFVRQPAPGPVPTPKRKEKPRGAKKAHRR